MAEEFIVVEKDEYGYIQTHHFDEERLYKFLNEKRELGDGDIDEDGNDTNPLVILDKFPIPSEHLSLEDRYGVYCCGDMWPDGGVFIIKRGSSFKPTMRKLTKTITVHEYASTPKRVRKPAAKKAVTKKNGSAK